MACCPANRIWPLMVPTVLRPASTSAQHKQSQRQASQQPPLVGSTRAPVDLHAAPLCARKAHQCCCPVRQQQKVWHQAATVPRTQQCRLGRAAGAHQRRQVAGRQKPRHLREQLELLLLIGAVPHGVGQVLRAAGCWWLVLRACGVPSAGCFLPQMGSAHRALESSTLQTSRLLARHACRELTSLVTALPPTQFRRSRRW